jgi:hypothetical protein
LTPETIFVLYVNLCAVTFAGWRYAHRHAAGSDNWRAVSWLTLSALVLLLIMGGLCFTLLLLWGLTWRGC